MKVITGTREFCIEEPTVVTIGKFDGRHQGHQKLLKNMLQQKENHGWKTAVFTFDMAPMGVVSGKRATVITTNEERRNNMRTMGMDYLVEYPFNREVAAMSPEDFVTEVLVKQMHAKAVVVGPGIREPETRSFCASSDRNTVLRRSSSRKSRTTIGISAAPMSGRNWTGAISRRRMSFWANLMPFTERSCMETTLAAPFWASQLQISFRRRRNTCRPLVSMFPAY